MEDVSNFNSSLNCPKDLAIENPVRSYKLTKNKAIIHFQN